MALKDTLRNMLKYAREKNEPTRVRLIHGLAIAIKVSGEMVQLQLSRNDVSPSMQEWRTVIQAIPGQCTVVDEPRLIKTESAYYLKGKIKIVKELING